MQAQVTPKYKNDDLAARAARVFPDRLPHAEHNRRAWMASVEHLRSLPNGSGWLLDVVQPRKTPH